MQENIGPNLAIYFIPINLKLQYDGFNSRIV
jgi:hypothetical protein